MADRDLALRAYLEDGLSRPFRWGVDDCILWPADWAVMLGRPDPAAKFRGRYRTAIGARRIIKRHGGLASLVTSVMGAPALPGSVPAPGDVGLVGGATADPDELTGAICAGINLWAVRAGGALRLAPFELHAFWKL